jgi:hypothetical protein
MYPHHKSSIKNLTHAFEKDESVLALLLGGSIAHGFAKPDSDIDVTIVVSPDEYLRHKQENKLHYNNRTLCTYDGYIDGKYVDLSFLRLVADRGSDPIRYAFQGNRILFSRIEGLEPLLQRIVRYPTDEKRERIERFSAQLLAWRWYYSEAIRQDNAYLKFLSIQKIILFSTRIVLAENHQLYPYHKWMLRVLESVERRPDGMMNDIKTLLSLPPWEKVNEFVLRVLAFVGIDHDEANAGWPTRFMQDTELRWMTDDASIDDI